MVSFSIVVNLSAYADDCPTCRIVGAAEPKLPSRWSLPIKGVGQETDSWCWACSTQMVMGYFGKHVSQGEMANLGIGLNDCTKVPVPAHCLYGFWGVPILDHFSYTYEYTHGPLSPDEIKHQIYVRRKPIMSGWKWTGDGAHYFVIKGYAEVQGVLMLEIADPAPPAHTDPNSPAGGAHYYCSYDKWVSDDGHKFMDAIYNIEKPANTPANLLRNGDFELGPDVEKFASLDKDSTAIPDWTVTRAQIDYVIAPWKPAHGARSIDLHGSPGYGGIRQSFKTTKGHRYRLTFSMAGAPQSVSGEGGVKSLAVSAAGKQQNFSFDTAGKSSANMGWADKEWEFDATDAMTTLEFHTLENRDPSNGPTIDHARVVSVPKK
jgi:choice-of-anchor C domain-containing protein